MTIRVLFTGEGSSDHGISEHVEAIAAELGKVISMTAPDLSRLGLTKCHSVLSKLRETRNLGDDYDLIVVHRDSDGEPPDNRAAEIMGAVAEEWASARAVPVIPVRMLEAWLLLDEPAIRHVAENPNGRMPLCLPKGLADERVPDPKRHLKETLALASGHRGRRLANFQKRFPQHRHKLLGRLDRNGPVSALPSWQEFVRCLRAELTQL